MTAWWHKPQNVSGAAPIDPRLAVHQPMGRPKPQQAQMPSNAAVWQSLLGAIGNTPAVPNYELPGTPAGVTMPELNAIGAINRHNDLSMPNVGMGPALNAPQLAQNAPLSSPGQLNMPSLGNLPDLSMPTLNAPGSGYQLDRPGALNTPGQLGAPPMLSNPTLQSMGNVNNPALQGGVSLADLAGAVSPYESRNPQDLYGSVASPATVVSPQFNMGNQGQNQMNVNTGIMPQMTPGAPVAAPSFNLAGMSPMAQQSAQANYQSTIPSAMTQLGAQHQQQAAQFGNDYQNAMAQSGLGWGQIGQQAQQINRQGQLGLQGQTFGLLGSMI
jgi:hypothetical protein